MAIDVSFSDLILEPDTDPLGPAEQLAETWERPCKFCREPLRGHFWLWGGKKFYGATCHQVCVERYKAKLQADTVTPAAQEIPERFREWDNAKFKFPRARLDAADFLPDSKLKTVALLGPVGLGKSRLAWQIVTQFFREWSRQRGQTRWPDYFLASDLLTEYDQSRVNRIKQCQFTFIDDLGDFPSGRMKSTLQQLIRYKVQAGHWLFLTIDDIRFDEDLVKHVFVDRALKIIIGD